MTPQCWCGYYEAEHNDADRDEARANEEPVPCPDFNLWPVLDD